MINFSAVVSEIKTKNTSSNSNTSNGSTSNSESSRATGPPAAASASHATVAHLDPDTKRYIENTYSRGGAGQQIEEFQLPEAVGSMQINSNSRWVYLTERDAKRCCVESNDTVYWYQKMY